MRGLGNNAASDIEKARPCTNFVLLENCAKYCLVPESEPKPELFQSRTGTGNGTATNHYGSTALALRVSQHLCNSVQEICHAAVVLFVIWQDGRVECWPVEAFAASHS